jgi:hypothetical protein
VLFKKTKTTTTNTKENLANIFKSALLNTLDKEQQHMLEELDIINTKAEELANIYFQSKIGFQTNRSFYNISEITSSGEYLIVGKKLLMDWSNIDKNTCKILKINASELVLKDVDLKVIYYYTKIKTT